VGVLAEANIYTRLEPTSSRTIHSSLIETSQTPSNYLNRSHIFLFSDQSFRVPTGQLGSDFQPCISRSSLASASWHLPRSHGPMQYLRAATYGELTRWARWFVVQPLLLLVRHPQSLPLARRLPSLPLARLQPHQLLL
jgi:hypothetical protein